MVRSNRLHLCIPSAITIKVQSRFCKISGPKGDIIQVFPKFLALEVFSKGLRITCLDGFNKIAIQQQGLVATLLKNHIIGVQFHFKKTLNVIGVGYRAKVENNLLFLSVGFSHSTFLQIPVYLTINIQNSNLIIISGINKQQVSLFASKIRKLKPPEPYKGKGIKYLSEIIIRKIGKSNKT